MTIPNKMKSRLSLKIYKNIGNKIADIMEDMETYPQMIKVTNQIKAKIKIIFAINILFMASPINTPKLVAMPLPPFNLRNIVQLWPHILARPKINLSESLEISSVDAVMLAKKMTGIIPFEISKNNPIAPILYPRVLAKLVAPMLPEPTLRKSTFLKILAKTKAKGTDPKR